MRIRIAKSYKALTVMRADLNGAGDFWLVFGQALLASVHFLWHREAARSKFFSYVGTASGSGSGRARTTGRWLSLIHGIASHHLPADG
ncbi:hypothetical protein K239x_18230 [Planctomycetes bacterium K23_9]|uniref:Uncharacterized protein n=1 Tax=Stieleria marina TaxID=1930275 RepID=A0A517NRW1_9BACT|nr:hypothetical protein K239x_18230 [Planctomycetes bacterium K23_9]